jgi:hypothetical protein
MDQGARIVVFAAAVLGAGCGINAHLPAGRLDTPETYGRTLAVGVDLGIQGSNALSLTPDYTITPVDTDEPSYSRSAGDVKVGASVGLAERFDLGLETAWDSPLMLQGKYQVLGEPQRTARQGNSSLAVTAAIGNHNQSGSSTGLTGGDYDAYRMTVNMVDLAAIAGYRFADTALLFGGPFVQTYWISGTHTLDDGPEVAYDLGAYQYGANVAIAFRVSKNLQLALEAVFAASRANDGHVTSGFLGGHLAAFRF